MPGALVRFARSGLAVALAVVLLLAGWSGAAAQPSAQRPNILWLTCEDQSPNFGCYGDPQAITPHIDKLAAAGVRYTHAFATSGVCAPARSCLVTGVFPTSLGTHLMRCQGRLPKSVKTYSYYLRQAGYYATNNSKTDYNFAVPRDAWDESSNKAHWKNRKPGQPFFAIFNFANTHESQTRARGQAMARLTQRLAPDERRDPAKMFIPPYHPDTPEARADWAHNAELITAMDYLVGDALAELDEAGLADDTIVFFYSDHGVGLPRAKRWLYDSGIRVPLVIRFGKNFRHLAPHEPGTATGRLVSFVDFAPTVLSLAGVKVPEHMQGVAFLGEQAGRPREYVHAVRDRMDERYDVVRAVRDSRYKYIRNYMPHLPYSQPLNYMEEGWTMKSMRRLAAEGKLEGPWALWMRSVKPAEELYDTQADPYELANLAGSPEHREILDRLRAEHLRWSRETIDLGLLPESDLRTRFGTGPEYDAVRRQPEKYPLEAMREANELYAQGAGNDAVGRKRLGELAGHDDPAVRYWAVLGLATVREPTPEVVDALAAAMRDRAPSVRIAAGEGLARAGRIDAAAEVLHAALDDENPWARLHAINVIDLLGGPVRERLMPRVRQSLKDGNEYVARVASYMVSAAGE